VRRKKGESGFGPLGRKEERSVDSREGSRLVQVVNWVTARYNDQGAEFPAGQACVGESVLCGGGVWPRRSSGNRSLREKRRSGPSQIRTPRERANSAKVKGRRDVQGKLFREDPPKEVSSRQDHGGRPLPAYGGPRGERMVIESTKKINGALARSQTAVGGRKGKPPSWEKTERRSI